MHPDSGGTSQGVRNIIPALANLGLHNEVVTMDDPDDNFNTNDPFLIHALGPAKGPWAYSPKLIPWLIKNLGRFDIIIINALWLYHGQGFLKALKRYKKSKDFKDNHLKYPKFFIMPHGMLDPYFQKAPDRKLKAIRNWIYWKLFEEKLVNSADGLLFTCKEELNLARESFKPYHPKSEISIGYGVEAPPAFNKLMHVSFFEKCPQVEGEPFLLFLSRIHEKKGLDILIEAYREIIQKIKKENNSGKHINHLSIPKLVIAGPGLDTQYGKKILQSVTGSEDLKNSVFFTGMLAGDAKWGAFYSAEAFILPSHQENFGIAVVESLACGKPVLISNQVNIWREIVDEGGGIVADDDIPGIKYLIQSWCKFTVEEKKQMGEKAKKTYFNNFSISQAAKNLYQLLND